MLIDKRAVVVGIQAAQREWQVLFHRRRSLKDVELTPSQDSAAFDPLRQDIGPVQGVGEEAGTIAAAMADQVGFNVTGNPDIPGICSNGNLVFEDGAGPG